MAFTFGMPPPGFDQLIAQKYALEKERTDASANAANAQAQLDQTRASLLPDESKAGVAETQARTRGIDITNRFAPLTLGANIFDTAARGVSSLSQASLLDQQAKTAAGLNTQFSPTSFGL